MGIVPPLGEADPLYGVTSRRPKGRGGGWLGADTASAQRPTCEACDSQLRSLFIETIESQYNSVREGNYQMYVDAMSDCLYADTISNRKSSPHTR